MRVSSRTIASAPYTAPVIPDQRAAGQTDSARPSSTPPVMSQQRYVSVAATEPQATVVRANITALKELLVWPQMLSKHAGIKLGPSGVLLRAAALGDRRCLWARVRKVLAGTGGGVLQRLRVDACAPLGDSGLRPLTYDGEASGRRKRPQP